MLSAATRLELFVRTGRLKVTDAMFPGGSPALVEPIYSGPLLSAPFNEQLAAALRAFVLARLEVLAQARRATRNVPEPGGVCACGS